MTSTPVRLVVVDDDVLLRTVFSKVLTRAGYKVFATTGSPDVVDLVDSQAPSAVLMDNHMPGTSGLDLIGLLRQRWSKETLPILLVSGSSNTEEIEAAMQSGANDFRRKPVEIPELLNAVRTLLTPAAVNAVFAREESP